MTRRDAGRRIAPVALLMLLFALLASAGNALAAAAGAPRIAVATMLPGEIFFERFGHNAIVVDDPAAGTTTAYNFGFFDPGEADFTGRFVRGDMRYRLIALPLEQDLAYYREVGRGVTLQWLDLDDAQARRLAAMLAENAKPENAAYRYDYFTDNCSTRVRDALDAVLDGGLRRQLQARSQGNTFRSESVRLARPAWWMRWGFDIGLGPAADRPNALWDDAFVPMRLAAALRDVRLADGRPLVGAEQTLLPQRLPAEPEPRAQPWWPWLLAGLAGAGLLLWAGGRDPRFVARVALPAWVACALLGTVSLFIWLGTDHRFGWANRNLLLLSPLCWALLPGAWRIARGGDGGGPFRWLLALVAALALLAPFLLWLPLQPQRNAHWIALLLPLQCAFAWVLLRAPRRARAPD